LASLLDLSAWPDHGFADLPQAIVRQTMSTDLEAAASLGQLHGDQ
jgi:hypothetical protein